MSLIDLLHNGAIRNIDVARIFDWGGGGRRVKAERNYQFLIFGGHEGLPLG